MKILYFLLKNNNKDQKSNLFRRKTKQLSYKEVPLEIFFSFLFFFKSRWLHYLPRKGMVSWIRNQEYFSFYSFWSEIETLFKGRIIWQEQKQKQQKETPLTKKPHTNNNNKKPNPIVHIVMLLILTDSVLTVVKNW